MTDKIEQEFFECYGVEQEWNYIVKHIGQTYVCGKEGILENKHLFERRNTYVCKVFKTYPQITSDKLLKIICILSKYIQTTNYDEDYIELYEISSTNIEKLKEEVLIDCIEYAKENDFEKYKNEIKEIIEND